MFDVVTLIEAALGSFKNYVDRKGWVGGQSNVYAHNVNDLFFLPHSSTRGRWVVNKSLKICLRRC